MREVNMAIIVKRHPEGHHYVPFDADLDPAHKRAIIGHLVETGHALEHVEKHKTLGPHVVLRSGPLAAKA